MAVVVHPQVTLAELSKHNSKEDCWVAVHSRVWDLTEFIDEHPGGAEILIQVAGQNATEEFDKVHAIELLEENLPVAKYKGMLLKSGNFAKTKNMEEDRNQEQRQNEPGALPQLQTMISAADFESVAKHSFTPKTWAFYSSAATDLVTQRQNREFLRRIMVKPRVLRDVRQADFHRSILGCKCSAPFFMSPAAMARLAHPDGELALARAAGAEGIIQCISSNASYPLAKIIESGSPLQPFFFQLYVNSDREKTTQLLRKARELGVRAILVTVDAPVPGKREADERIAAGHVKAAISGATATNDKKGGGLGRLMAQYVDRSLTWSDLQWIRRESGMPVVLKGVQTVEDAKLAVKYGVDGIFLSNHGGRSLDTSQPAILNLLELRLHYPEAFSKLEVYVDGGFERGLDILKAIALGATAVGIGRPYLYSLVYGEEGAVHLTQVLKDEIEVSMRLCGATSLDDMQPDMLNTSDIDHLVRNTSLFQPLPLKENRSKL